MLTFERESTEVDAKRSRSSQESHNQRRLLAAFVHVRLSVGKSFLYFKKVGLTAR